VRYQIVPSLKKRAVVAVRIAAVVAAVGAGDVRMFAVADVAVAVPEPPFITMMSRITPEGSGRLTVLVVPEVIRVSLEVTVIVPAAEVTTSPVELRPLIWFKATLRTFDEPVAVRS
jgi:hypothetical protein